MRADQPKRSVLSVNDGRNRFVPTLPDAIKVPGVEQLYELCDFLRVGQPNGHDDRRDLIAVVVFKVEVCDLGNARRLVRGVAADAKNVVPHSPSRWLNARMGVPGPAGSSVRTMSTLCAASSPMNASRDRFSRQITWTCCDISKTGFRISFVTSFGTDTRREEKPTQTTKRINAITERADDFVDALK